MVAKLRTRRRMASALLSAVIGLRVLLSFFLLHTIPRGLTLWSVGIFFLAVATDALDGQVARRSGASPVLGPYSDAAADFLLVLVAFWAFVREGLYPFWVLSLFILMFAQFVLTSRLKHPIYDPVGKYYGVFLFAAIALTLLFPHPFVYRAVLMSVLGFTIAAVVSRSLFLLRHWRKEGARSSVTDTANERDSVPMDRAILAPIKT
jgi:CDP-diacylglycerol--glycerol-3-phosphate 3-phosphatidyltransferase